MKKISIVLLIVIILILSNTKARANIIPDEAIRFRVIANSNSDYDQEIKMLVKDSVEKKLYNLLKNTKGIDSAREIINANIDDIDNVVNKTLKDNNYDKEYNINFGMNYFPEKEYKGEGNNWWCVLFPPLCLLEAEESDEVEYKFFIQELIDKYL